MKPMLLSSVLAALIWPASAVDVDKDPCGLRAWVRAEDLSPSRVSNGELRVQVKQANCTTHIVSVALRLQLSEFSEVKYMKDGALIPGISSGNHSAVTPMVRWPAGIKHLMYEDDAFEKAKTDPAVWAVKAEGRIAWTTEALLIKGSLNFSQPIVTPFVVSSPAVNYPPATERYRWLLDRGKMARHSETALTYRYVAVVTFDDGRVVEVPAGYTNFVPAAQVLSTNTPVTVNGTFGTITCNGDYPLPLSSKLDRNLDRCLPEEKRSTFIAEVTFDGGNVVQRGQLLKGRATIHSSGGSTMMDMADVSLVTIRHDHWAHEQAVAGGDTSFASSAPCRSLRFHSMLSPDSPNHAHIFDERRTPRWASFSSGPYVLFAAKPHFEFEIQVPPDAVPDFTTHYVTGQNFLELGLLVRFNEERVAECTKRGGAPVADFVDDVPVLPEAAAEAGLWDDQTPVGAPRYSDWECKLGLNLRVPITVVGDAPVHEVDDYRAPGRPSPVLLPARAPIAFPAARPVVRVEPQADTAARLLQAGEPGEHFMPQGLAYPDPVVADRAGGYAGVLWRKKLVAEERGILPSGQESVQEENGQRRFGVRGAFGFPA
ncbi:hypothetical protein FB451DRAFT_1388358 [Mycena latifolia]|nr:hypothetical protein FB451DRAFT_1388358 [Mycena latifolia]